MTITITETAGSATANSYVSVADATTYLEARLNSSSWTSAATESQKAALVEAFREIQTRAFAGRRTTTTQSAQWPRQWAIDPDSPSGTFYDSSDIPQRVIDAQCELALEFLRAGTTDLAALPASDGIIQKTVDVLTTVYAAPYERPKGLARYPRVLALLRPLFEDVGITPILRG